MYFYSATTRSFYITGVNEAMPHDVVEISEERYHYLLNSQSEGGKIVTGENGLPVIEMPSEPTQTQQFEIVKTQKIFLIQKHLDSEARKLGYDDAKTAVTYAEEPAVEKFQIEGKAIRMWRSLVWEACYAMLEDIQAGTMAIPSDETLLNLLPTLEINY